MFHTNGPLTALATHAVSPCGRTRHASVSFFNRR